ncbi:MAG: aminotransferase class I/II-fold pyridoxal phosphate-dependent enzyme [Enhygromyxa sp.]
MSALQPDMARHIEDNFDEYTYDMFMYNMSPDPEEVELFSKWLEVGTTRRLNSFAPVRLCSRDTSATILRADGRELEVLSFSGYNYLGYARHPAVIASARAALERYGLGAASSPIISGNCGAHAELARALVDFFKLPSHGVSLFSSGYAVNLGTIQAFAKPGSQLILDDRVHMSLLDGARLANTKIAYFEHGNMRSLERQLDKHCDGHTRVLVCVESLYSGDGDFGPLAEVVALAKRYDAYTLVDEAHATLVAGASGRGVCEQQGVLGEVDFYVMTFSKAFGGVGGALLAKRSMCQYIDWYAKCRAFSCALDPAVAGGLRRVVELAGSDDGDRRRARLHANVAYLREALREDFDLGLSTSWILTVLYGEERNTVQLNSYLQEQGLDVSPLQFPAVAKGEARLRLFVTSEHTREQLDTAAAILRDAGRRFGFISTGR